MNNENEPQGSWYVCQYCGKKILRRKPNGLFVFKFGRNNNGENVVEMEIFGSVKIRCFRDNCRAWNQFDFFPFGE